MRLYRLLILARETRYTTTGEEIQSYTENLRTEGHGESSAQKCVNALAVFKA